jgi:hypothetical protein
MEVALFRTDTLPLGDGMSVGMKQCAGPLGSQPRTSVLELGDSSLNLPLASTLC